MVDLAESGNRSKTLEFVVLTRRQFNVLLFLGILFCAGGLCAAVFANQLLPREPLDYVVVGIGAMVAGSIILTRIRNQREFIGLRVWMNRDGLGSTTAAQAWELKWADVEKFEMSEAGFWSKIAGSLKTARAMLHDGTESPAFPVESALVEFGWTSSHLRSILSGGPLRPIGATPPSAVNLSRIRAFDQDPPALRVGYSYRVVDPSGLKTRVQNTLMTLLMAPTFLLMPALNLMSLKVIGLILVPTIIVGGFLWSRRWQVANTDSFGAIIQCTESGYRVVYPEAKIRQFSSLAEWKFSPLLDLDMLFEGDQRFYTSRRLLWEEPLGERVVPPQP
jgi:hypothetical protein